MAKKYPSRNTKTFKKDIVDRFFRNAKRTGKSNNQLSPHKRWRQSFKLQYPTNEKLVSVEYYDKETGHTGGPVLTLAEFKKNIGTIKNDPDYLGFHVFNNKTSKELNQSTYKSQQGITLGYTLFFDDEVSE